MGAPAWIWWPAHYVLILLQAQTGRVNAAQTWLAKADLPPVLAAAVRASIDVALGRKEAAIKTADGVLDQLGVPHPWRLIAAGAKLAALADDQTGQRDAMLAAEDRSSALASVALFPDAARALVAGQLPTGLVAQLPGLQQPDRAAHPAPGRGAGRTGQRRNHGPDRTQVVHLDRDGALDRQAALSPRRRP